MRRVLPVCGHPSEEWDVERALLFEVSGSAHARNRSRLLRTAPPHILAGARLLCGHVPIHAHQKQRLLPPRLPVRTALRRPLGRITG